MLAGAGQVQAGIINTSDRGWYQPNGFHDPDNLSYLVSNRFFAPFRNFFVFDLSGVSTLQTITSASLRLWNPLQPQNDFMGTASYEVYDVSTSLSSLTSGAGPAAYTDLGTGTSYGARDVTSADAGTFVTVNLNAAGLVALNASRGATFATGGTVVSSDFATIFSSTIGPLEPSDGLTTLVFETQAVPEPTSIAIWGFGAVGISLIAHRKKKHIP
jgi:hypothetical protein